MGVRITIPNSRNTRPASINELRDMSDSEMIINSHRISKLGPQTIQLFRTSTQVFMEKFREAQQNPPA